jgi:hypothetical protein
MPDLSNIFQQSLLCRRQMTLNRCVELFEGLHVCVAACARTVAALCVCVTGRRFGTRDLSHAPAS